jgi:TRAP-type mannitol/chloroaromatic compound transport system permease small subunit
MREVCILESLAIPSNFICLTTYRSVFSFVVSIDAENMIANAKFAIKRYVFNIAFMFSASLVVSKNKK